MGSPDGTESAPFEAGEDTKVAVKVIDRPRQRADGREDDRRGGAEVTYEVDQPDPELAVRRAGTPLVHPARARPKLVERRRDSFVFGPKDSREGWDLSDGTLRRYKDDAEKNDYENAYELGS